METWKDIIGYEAIYLISNTGKVKSLDNWVDIGLGRRQFKPSRILKAAKGSHGYLTVALCLKGKQISTCIHTILSKAFIPNPNNYRCINHKDGDKLNNSLNNLEWVSHSINNKHAYDTGLKKPYRKITSEHVTQIRALSKYLGLKHFQLAAMYAAHPSAISEIVRFKLRING